MNIPLFIQRELYSLREENSALKAELAILKEALEFYANESNWCDGDNSSLTDLDNGERARTALGIGEDGK